MRLIGGGLKTAQQFSARRFDDYTSFTGLDCVEYEIWQL